MTTLPVTDQVSLNVDSNIPGINEVDKQRWLRAWEKSGPKTSETDQFKQGERDCEWNDSLSGNSKHVAQKGEAIDHKASKPFHEQVIVKKAENSKRSLSAPSISSGPLSAKQQSINPGSNQYLVGKYSEKIIGSTARAHSNATVRLLDYQVQRWFPDINIHVREVEQGVDITIRDFINKDSRLDKVVARIKKFLSANELPLGVLKVNGVKQKI